jgi:hypothetical protein
MMPGLGRIEAPDDRDREYPMEQVIGTPTPDRKWRYWWKRGPKIDRKYGLEAQRIKHYGISTQRRIRQGKIK